MAESLMDLSRILKLVEQISWSQDRLHEHRTERLRALLRHALDHSAYWRKHLGGVCPEEVEITDLPTFPVLTKVDLMEHWDEIVTVPGITLADCRKHLAGLPEEPAFDDYLLGHRVVCSTGGTSGRQAVILRDLDEWLDTFFANIRWTIRAAIEAGGEPMENPTRVGILGDCPRHMGTAMTKALGLKLVPVSLSIEEQCNRLNAIQPSIVAGYASALARLAKAAIGGALEVDLKTVASASECLDSNTRALLRRAWPDAIISNGYGSTECGMIASGTGDEESLYINDDFFVLEGLAENREPTPPGETSHSVAVTCLEARAFPLIRYELQDRISLSSERSPEGLPHTCIESIGGRTSDWLRWGDAEVHPYAFTSPLTDDPAVDLYQVEQTEEGAHIRIIPTGQATLNEEQLLGEIRKDLEASGAPTRLTVERVSEIARVGDGQKHRVIVPLAGSVT